MVFFKSAENYNNEGCVFSVSLVPGDYDNFIKDLSGVTKGDFQFEVAGAENAAARTEETEKKGKGGKGGGGGGGKGGKKK